MSPDELMNAAAVGKYLSGKSERTGRRFIEERHVPVYRIRGKLYVKRSELEAWVEEQKLPQVTLKELLNVFVERAKSRRAARKDGK